MISVLIRWLFLWITLFFVGRKLIALFLSKKNDARLFIFPSIWSGFVLLMIFLQFFSLFLPLKNYLVVYIWSVFFIVSLFSFFKFKKRKINFNFSFFSFFFVSLATIILGLYFSTGIVNHYDTYLYNFNAVAWNREFSVIPGLANLHSRLGFNSSFNLFATFVEFGTKAGYSAFIANGFLLVTVALQYLHHIFNSKIKVNNRLFLLFLLPFIYLALVEGNLSSLSTDLAMYSLALSWLGTLLVYPEFKFLILAQSFLILVFKLSGVFTAIFSFICAIDFKKNFSKTILLPILVIFAFMTRNTFISGYPFYPSTLLKTNFVWSMPIEKAKNEALDIKAWARMPGNDYMSSLDHGLAYWWPAWWQRASLTNEIKILFFSVPVLIFSAFLKKWSKEELLILMTCLASICLIFYQAPDLRFGRVFFWILGALALFRIFVNLKISDKNKFNLSLLVTLILFIKFVFPAIYFKHQPVFSLNSLNHFKKIEYEVKMSNEGQEIYTPIIGDQCGNSPLPCTPYFNENLEFIRKNELKHGFKL